MRSEDIRKETDCRQCPDVTSKNDESEFGLLMQFVTAKRGENIIVMGDFNAHLGKMDLTNSDKKFIGPHLLHDYCNVNGDEVKNLVQVGRLQVVNTWKDEPSLSYTWANAKSRSQIDHVLCNGEGVRFVRMYATWVPKVRTDHKLISAELNVRLKESGRMAERLNERRSDNARTSITKKQPRHSQLNPCDKLDLSALRTEDGMRQ